MMRSFLVLLISLFSISVIGQNFIVTGVVTDQQTGESLIGANVVYGEGKGTVTDFDGKFKLSLPNGEYSIVISYVGYDTEVVKLVVNGKSNQLNIKLESKIIDEVVVSADFARQRETPVAFTNVLPAKIEEELAGKDLPMILNSTPGVYATQQGGGDGDARITIRGFSQNNVAVMIDGIPVNDMENGWVYWSNWFGLDAITRSMQVQRGLGVSKLALPSVGGTMNIITKGIENKRGGSVKQYVDQNGKLQSTFGFSSGQLSNGWAFTVAGSYKSGKTYVKETSTDGFFYYFKLDKRWKNHITSITGFGAPQKHDQRQYKRAIATYDTVYAKELGIDLNAPFVDDNGVVDSTKYNYRPPVNNMGISYNQHWGYLKRDKDNPDAALEVLNEQVNEYHKPQFSLRDSWTVSDKLFLSNTVYLSIGKGGGVKLNSSEKNNQFILNPDSLGYGQLEFQKIYDNNSKDNVTPFGITNTIKEEWSPTLRQSEKYLVKSHNEHFWYGLLSSFDYTVNEFTSVSGGVDIRSYEGLHYQSVHDLLGGDYVVDMNDRRVNDSAYYMKKEGDKLNYFDRGFVRYGGAFGQVEYKTGLISTFCNISTAVTSYKKENVFSDTASNWKNSPSYTIKAGLNYNITERINVFINGGLLSKVRPYKNYFFGYTVHFANFLDNEIVKAIELGASYGSPVFSVNFNSYYTEWKNKPVGNVKNIEEETEGVIPGLDARHAGVELDFIYKPLSNLEIQGLVSLGDWVWTSKVDDVLMFNTKAGLGTDPVDTVSVDARGIHVGNAAQTQLGGSIRYEPFKGFYINTRTTYFGKHYSDFNPESSLDKNNNTKDSWKVPAYNLVDLHVGYKFKIKSLSRITFGLKASVTNVLNEVYIADAKNNSTNIQLQHRDFDAASAEVFFGAPRRTSLSLKITF